jgi:hypothetical protein
MVSERQEEVMFCSGGHRWLTAACSGAPASGEQVGAVGPAEGAVVRFYGGAEAAAGSVCEHYDLWALSHSGEGR